MKSLKQLISFMERENETQVTAENVGVSLDTIVSELANLSAIIANLQANQLAMQADIPAIEDEEEGEE